jgi:hypothetical protein
MIIDAQKVLAGLCRRLYTGRDPRPPGKAKAIFISPLPSLKGEIREKSIENILGFGFGLI